MTPEEIRAGVEALLRDVSAGWTDAHRADVQRWLDAGEHGLALEHLSAVLQDERYPVTAAQRDRLVALATAASCDPRTLDVDWLVR